MTNRFEPHQVAARIVDGAGGQLIGRTRLQKVACLATLAGFLDEFAFEYRHYGPYSEELAGSMEIAAALGFVQEQEAKAEWGGWYSIYRTTEQTPREVDAERARFLVEAARISPIQLELAATAAFLHATEGLDAKAAWAETEARKPDKAAHGRLQAAQDAYRKLLVLPTLRLLPAIA